MSNTNPPAMVCVGCGVPVGGLAPTQHEDGCHKPGTMLADRYEREPVPPEPKWLHADPKVLWVGETYADAAIFRKYDDGSVTLVARDQLGNRVGYPIDRGALIAWLKAAPGTSSVGQGGPQ